MYYYPPKTKILKPPKMKKTVYQGKYIKVEEETINGNNWEKVILQGGIIVYPFTGKDTLLLVKEIRPHENPSIRVKPVTGIFEKEFSIFENANREMQEEIGFKSDNLELLLSTKTSGTLNGFQHFVIAKDLEPSKLPNPDGEETIQEVIEVNINDLIKDLIEGKINYRSSFLGIYHLHLKNLIA